MQHARIFAALTLATSFVAAAAAPALAGGHGTYSVTIVSGAAFGSLVTARTSSNSNEDLGCTTTGYAGGAFGFCRAITAANVSVSCFTFDASIIGAIRAIDSESYVNFQFDKSGQCTSVMIDTDSVYKP